MRSVTEANIIWDNILPQPRHQLTGGPPSPMAVA